VPGDRLEQYKRTMKKHHSILRPIVYIVILLFFVTVILDPFTKSIEETEILINVGSYPYDKARVAIWGEIEDRDEDGLSDSAELDGLELESDFIILNSGDYAIYRFGLEYDAFYMLNFLSRNTLSSTLQIDIVAPGGNSTHRTSLGASDWGERTAIPELDLDAGDTEMNITLESGKIYISGLSLRNHNGNYGITLDGDAFETTNAPPGSTSGRDTITIYTDPDNPDSDFDGMLDGYEYLAAKDGGWQDPVITNNRYAFIMGGGSSDSLENFLAFWNTAEAVYNTIHDYYGYERKNIDVLFWDGKPKGADIVTASTEKVNIEASLNSLIAKVGPNDFVFLYITGHGYPNSGGGIAIFDYGNLTENDHMSYEWLDGFMEELSRRASRVTLIIEACFSGQGVEVFPRDNLVFVASSDSQSESFGQRDGLGAFGFHTIKAMQHPALANVPTYKEIVNIDLSFDKDKFMISIEELFHYVNDKISLPPYSQFPQLDGNADYIANEQDEGIAANTYL